MSRRCPLLPSSESPSLFPATTRQRPCPTPAHARSTTSPHPQASLPPRGPVLGMFLPFSASSRACHSPDRRPGRAEPDDRFAVVCRPHPRSHPESESKPQPPSRPAPRLPRQFTRQPRYARSVAPYSHPFRDVQLAPRRRAFSSQVLPSPPRICPAGAYRAFLGSSRRLWLIYQPLFSLTSMRRTASCPVLRLPQTTSLRTRFPALPSTPRSKLCRASPTLRQKPRRPRPLHLPGR